MAEGIQPSSCALVGMSVIGMRSPPLLSRSSDAPSSLPSQVSLSWLLCVSPLAPAKIDEQQRGNKHESANHNNNPLYHETLDDIYPKAAPVVLLNRNEPLYRLLTWPQQQAVGWDRRTLAWGCAALGLRSVGSVRRAATDQVSYRWLDGLQHSVGSHAGDGVGTQRVHGRVP